MSAAYKVILGADRTLISEYAWDIFLGFYASVLRGLVAQDWLYNHFLYPCILVRKENGETQETSTPFS